MVTPTFQSSSEAALQVALCSQQLMAFDGVVSLSQLSESNYPYQRIYNRVTVAAASKKISRTPVTELNRACQAVFSKTDGIINYVVHEHGKALANKACSLTITRPDGFSRTYLTRAEHARHKDAEAAAAQFALDMGVIDFLQRGDDADKEVLERARANRDAEEEEDAVVHTIWGQIYVNMKPTDGGDYIAAINRCCRISTNGRVAPFWGELSVRVLDKVKKLAPTGYGCVLSIKLTPTIMHAWSVPCSYNTGREAMDAVSQLALRSALEFTHSRGRLAEQPFPFRISINEYAQNLKNLVGRVPYDVTPEGKNNAVAWVNTTAAKCKARVEFEFIAAKLGPMDSETFGCLLRVTPPWVKEKEWRSWFAEAVFKTQQDARVAVCFQAIVCGDIDVYLTPPYTVKHTPIPARRYNVPLQVPPPPPPPSGAQSVLKVAKKIANFQSECNQGGGYPTYDITYDQGKRVWGGALLVTAGLTGAWQWEVKHMYKDEMSAQGALITLAHADKVMSLIKKAVGGKIKGTAPNPQPKKTALNPNTIEVNQIAFGRKTLPGVYVTPTNGNGASPVTPTNVPNLWSAPANVGAPANVEAFAVSVKMEEDEPPKPPPMIVKEEEADIDFSDFKTPTQQPPMPSMVHQGGSSPRSDVAVTGPQPMDVGPSTRYDVHRLTKEIELQTKGKLKPQMYGFSEKNGDVALYGAVVYVKINPTVTKTYYTPPTHVNIREAMLTVSSIALAPTASPHINVAEFVRQHRKELQKSVVAEHTRYNLAEFVKTLGPLPNGMAIKGGIDPVVWITQFAASRNIRIVFHHFNVDCGRGHGCILVAYTRKYGAYAWVAEPHFTNKNAAQSAVCLVAAARGRFMKILTAQGGRTSPPIQDRATRYEAKLSLDARTQYVAAQDAAVAPWTWPGLPTPQSTPQSAPKSAFAGLSSSATQGIVKQEEGANNSMDVGITPGQSSEQNVERLSNAVDGGPTRQGSGSPSSGRSVGVSVTTRSGDVAPSAEGSGSVDSVAGSVPPRREPVRYVTPLETVHRSSSPAAQLPARPRSPPAAPRGRSTYTPKAWSPSAPPATYARRSPSVEDGEVSADDRRGGRGRVRSPSRSRSPDYYRHPRRYSPGPAYHPRDYDDYRVSRLPSRRSYSRYDDGDLYHIEYNNWRVRRTPPPYGAYRRPSPSYEPYHRR